MDLDSDNKPFSNLYSSTSPSPQYSFFSFFYYFFIFILFSLLFLLFIFKDNIITFIHSYSPNFDFDISNKLATDINLPPSTTNYQPEPNPNPQKGWCLIGNNTCAPVGVNDLCMSGDIFPSLTKCINPNLR